MSRSYKKGYIDKDRKNRFAKKMANRKVRRSKCTLQKCGYKKLFCPWDIDDRKPSMLSFAEYIEEFGDKSKTWKEMYREWYKLYRMK